LALFIPSPNHWSSIVLPTACAESCTCKPQKAARAGGSKPPAIRNKEKSNEKANSDRRKLLSGIWVGFGSRSGRWYPSERPIQLRRLRQDFSRRRIHDDRDPAPGQNPGCQR